MSANELQALERTDFLTWRRNLAQLTEQEHVMITPYERNLDFWRQLWRVVERRYSPVMLFFYHSCLTETHSSNY